MERFAFFYHLLRYEQILIGRLGSSFSLLVSSIMKFIKWGLLFTNIGSTEERRTIFWEKFLKEGVLYSLKARGENFRRGTPISDISSDHPRGGGLFSHFNKLNTSLFQPKNCLKDLVCHLF